MQSKAKLFGHALHPILIVFPLGLLSTAVIFDVIYLVDGGATWSTVSFWMMVAGIGGGLLAALFGLIDYWSIPPGTRAKQIGRIHALVNATALIVYGGSVWLRRSAPEAPSVAALVLSFVGVLIVLLGGWFGGELVERLGVGVIPGANLNAPNSLPGLYHSRARNGKRVRQVL